MQKLNMFPLLTDKWLGGTRYMTLEEKGLYLELLLYLFIEKRPIKDRHHVARICGIDPRLAGRLWPKLSDKFINNQHGFTHQLVTKILNNSGRIKGLDASATVGGIPAQEKEKEYKEINKEKSPAKKQQKKVVYTEEFEELWKAYPKRPGGNPKESAFKAYKKRLIDYSHEDLLNLVSRYAQFCEATQCDHIQHAATFFGSKFDPDCTWSIPVKFPIRQPQQYPTRKKENVNDYL